MKALITGANGYIGSNFVSYLVKNGWYVDIVVRANSRLNSLNKCLEKVKVHVYDGTSDSLIKIVGEAKPNNVYHFASLFLVEHTDRDIKEIIESNIIFGAQLVEAMVRNNVKNLINTGTSWQYYKGNNNPVNLYAATKQAFESILSYYVDAHELKVITLYLFDTYGPNDSRSKLIPMLWNALEAKTTLSMSPGEQMIDLVHIDDVIKAFYIAGNMINEQEIGHNHYGVGTGKPIKIMDLVNLFQDVVKVKLDVTFGGRQYRMREVMMPWEDYQRIPGWHPQVELSDGLAGSRPDHH